MAEEGSRLLPVRMLNEWVYCPRLFHLEFVQGLFADSRETVEGRGEHERGRARTRGARLEPGPWPETDVKQVTFESEADGIAGKFDVVAQTAGGQLVPVEVKHGRAPSDGRTFDVCGIELPGGIWPTDQVQLGAQALLLRAAGHECVEGRVFYRGSRTTTSVAIDESLLTAVRRVVASATETAKGPMPPPLADSPKCVGCSLVGICLPDETNALREDGGGPVRRLVPARADGGGVYVLTQGARVGKVSRSLTITIGEETQEIPLKDCEHLAIFGGVHVSAQAIQAMLEDGKIVTWNTLAGKCVGRAVPSAAPNLSLRRAQFRLAEEPGFCARVSRAIVAAKISNQRTLLRRNAEATEVTLLVDDLGRLAAEVEGEQDMDRLRGIEGAAARAYFNGLSKLLGADEEEQPLLEGRSRRPPGDPGNAALSFGYALLTNECIGALTRVGLDPDLGFMHAVEPGRPALALDLMEAFRPLIVDSIVLRGFKTKQLKGADFVRVGPACRMSDAARRRFISMYEQRVDELVTHPVFDTRMSYRRIVEVDARLLARCLAGELATWMPMVTR